MCKIQYVHTISCTCPYYILNAFRKMLSDINNKYNSLGHSTTVYTSQYYAITTLLAIIINSISITQISYLLLLGFFWDVYFSALKS